MSDLKNLFIAYIIYLIGVIFMIVFFDLDGTLISDDEAYIIPDSAVNAIHKAQENGHLMYVDTGRTDRKSVV